MKAPYVIAESDGVSSRCAHMSASLPINFDEIQEDKEEKCTKLLVGDFHETLFPLL